MKARASRFVFPASAEDRHFVIVGEADVTLDAQPDQANFFEPQSFFMVSHIRQLLCQGGCEEHSHLGLTEMSAIVMILPACGGLGTDNLELIRSTILLF